MVKEINVDYQSEDDEDYDDSGPTPRQFAATYAGGTLAAVAVAALGPVIPFVAAAGVIAYMVLKDPKPGGKA